MISPQFHPIIGGYERAAFRLSTALTNQGCTVTVLTERRKKNWKKNDIINKFQVIRLWCIHKPHLHQLTTLFSFAIFLLSKGQRYHFWHVHQYGLIALLTIILGKCFRKPVVLKLTNSGSQGLEVTCTALPFPKFAKTILRHVDMVVALTQETKQEALKFGIPPDRITLIGNGIDGGLFHPANSHTRLWLRKNNDIQAEGIAIWIGRLRKEKNPEGLLNAWLQAFPRMPKGWKLILVGEGPLLPVLQSFIEQHKLHETVMLVGKQNNVEEWLAMADIYVTTSHNEGLSNTMLEALATGLPVIATKVSGVKENIEQTGAGIVVEIGDMNAIGSAFIQLTQNPSLRKKLGHKGRTIFNQKFTLTKVATSYQEMYKTILSDNKQ